MANCRILWENLAELDSTSITASSQVSAMPVSKLTDPQRSTVWRSTGCGSEYIGLSFDKGREINCLAMVNYNLSGNAEITISSGQFSETYQVWPSMMGWEEGRWRFTAWGEMLDMDDYQRYYGDSCMIWYLSEELILDSVRITITDPGNPDGYVQVGGLLLGSYMEFPRQFLLGNTDGAETRTEKTFTDSGATRADVKNTQQVTTLNFQGLPADFVDWELRNFRRQAGTHGKFVIDGMPDAPGLSRLNHLFYAELNDLPQVTRHLNGLGEASITLRECA